MYECFGYKKCEKDKWNKKERRSVSYFQKGKFELLALNERKMMGNQEVSWYGIIGILVGVIKNEKIREAVAILPHEMGWCGQCDFGRVCCGILWVKLS